MHARSFWEAFQASLRGRGLGSNPFAAPPRALDIAKPSAQLGLFRACVQQRMLVDLTSFEQDVRSVVVVTFHRDRGRDRERERERTQKTN